MTPETIIIAETSNHTIVKPAAKVIRERNFKLTRTKGSKRGESTHRIGH
jgi:hypothetical protein